MGTILERETISVLDLLRQSGMLRARDFTARGISRQRLKRLVDSGEIERLGRGLYSLPNTEITRHHTLAEVCARVSHAIVCLSSALQFHNLTTQSPAEVWILIDKEARGPKLDYPPLRVFHASRETLTAGVEEHCIEGVTVRVTNVPKTVADCFKYRNKIGLDVALEALKESLRRDLRTGRRPTTREDIRHYARICHVERVMQPYLEALS
jgi:predicted transcriptional regulator of viral defense system